MKDLGGTKIFKEIKFEGVWSEFEAENCFSRQSFTKYLRLALVFMGNSTLPEKFNFCFLKRLLLVFTKFAFLQDDWALGYYSMGV